ncbi:MULTISPECIES: hypothetical protein [unclassified Modestobacter]
MELQLLFQVVRKSARIILACALMGALVGLISWVVLPAEHEASAVIVMDSNAVTAPGQTPFTGDPERYVTGEMEFLRSFSIAEQAGQALAPSLGPQQVLDSLELSHVTGSDVVLVTARADTPAQARDLANAVADTYVQTRENAAQAALDAQRQALEAQAELLEGRLATEDLSDSLAGALTTQYAQLTASVAELSRPGVLRDATRVVDEARDATSTRTVTLPAGVLGGAVIGGLLGTLAMVIRAVRRPRVADALQAESLTGRPILTTLPHVRGLGRLKRDQLLARMDEPMGRLAALVDVEKGTSDRVVITCCSAASSAGCSTVASLLAMRLARDGLRVAVVTSGPLADVAFLMPSQLDIRNSAGVGPERRRGRASRHRAVAGDRRGADALAGRPSGPPPNEWQWSDGALPGLTVAHRSEPATLSSDDVRVAIEQGAGYDVVIIDASSLLSSTFATTAVRESDSVVLVVPVLEQFETDLRLAMRVLDAKSEAPLHVVLNDR